MEALAKSEVVTLAPASEQRVTIMRRVLQEETEIRAMVVEFINKHMVDGSDYGKIPGTDKPTLLKPGAEKLVDLFRCTPKFSLVKNEEDFEKGFFNYIFRVRLESRDSKDVLAEGFGSANSREGRYRWRDAQRKCPNCAKATIFKSKHEDGFYCWAKKGGCGAKFAGDAPAITSQVQGKVENDDIATLANTILKMAKKRALVDGAIALARCSDLLTQDLEDLPHDAPEPTPEPERHAAPRSAPPPPPQEKASSAHLRARVKRIWTASKMDGVRFAAFARGVLGSDKASSEWTEDEITKVEDAMHVIAQEERHAEA